MTIFTPRPKRPLKRRGGRRSIVRMDQLGEGGAGRNIVLEIAIDVVAMENMTADRIPIPCDDAGDAQRIVEALAAFGERGVGGGVLGFELGDAR